MSKVYVSLEQRTQEVSPADVILYAFNMDNGLIGLMDCGGSNLVYINEQLRGIVKIIATARIFYICVHHGIKRALIF